MIDKFILDCSNEEILEEVSSILGKKVVPRKERIGWITDKDDAYINPDGCINEKKLKDLYDTGLEAEDYIVTLSLTSLRNRPAELFSLIKTACKGINVLEYGSCSSTHGIACAQLGANVHILDISNKMLKFAQERYKRRNLNVTIHTDKSTLPDNTFDIVICADVIEHVPDPVEVTKAIWRSMKIGGIAHFHVSYMVNIGKGHLAQAIKAWKIFSKTGLLKLFKKINTYNFIKI